MKFVRSVLAAATVVALAAPASALTCSIGTMSFTLNISAGATCVAGNDLGNNGITATNATLFGLNGWVVADSTDSGTPGDQSVQFSTTPQVNTGFGNWAIGSYNGYDPLMVVLKSSTYYGAFLITQAISGLSGNWSIWDSSIAKGRGGYKNLSHASVYRNTPAPVPLPAAGLLLIGSLGAIAGLRRRKSV